MLPGTRAGSCVVMAVLLAVLGSARAEETKEGIKVEGPASLVTLTLMQPTERAVFQRSRENRAAVPVEGTFTGTAGRIEARAVAMGGSRGPKTNWEVVDAAPAAGGFAGHLMAPAGGWYRIEVRALDGDKEVGQVSVERVGVGEVFITAGQSNAANWGKPRQTAQDDRVSAANVETGRWQACADPQPGADGGGGSPWPAMGDLLAQRRDVPIGIISTGVGATSVAQWQPDGLYGRIRSALKFVGKNGARAILWHQGESDNVSGTTAEGYARLLANIIKQSWVDAGREVPWGVALAAWHPAGRPGKQAAVIAGQRAVIQNVRGVFAGPDTDEMQAKGAFYRCDGVHFNERGLREHGRRWAEAILGRGSGRR